MNPDIDMTAIAHALHKHITSTGAQPAEEKKEMPEGGQKPVKSGPGFDSHTKVLSKALIHKLLTVV